MSLLKLLSVGHSLHRVRHEQAAHYRPSEVGALPKFEARPKFASTTSTSTAGIPKVAMPVSSPAGQSRPRSDPHGDPLTAAARSEFLLSQPATTGAGAGVATIRVERNSGHGRVDEVRVLRNDLSESDLEVVRGTVPAGPVRPAVPLGEGSQLEMAGLAWNRLTARLFAAGRERV